MQNANFNTLSFLFFAFDVLMVVVEGGGPVDDVEPVEPVGEGVGRSGTQEPVTVGMGAVFAAGVGVVGVPGGVWFGVEGAGVVVTDVNGEMIGAWL